MDRGIQDLLLQLKEKGTNFTIGTRNQIKTIPYEGKVLNVKIFKIPSLFNGVVYKFFRKSKARRSYEYAHLLTKKGIGTPLPVGYYENFSLFTLKDSYYVCEHIQYDFLFRDLLDLPIEESDHIRVLKEFVKFTFLLHSEGIEFLDHSPGNTLIKKNNTGGYDFYLVDLNRMKFHTNMTFDQRMKNMERITPRQDQIEVISEEYAILYGKTKQEVFEKLVYHTSAFQKKVIAKKKFKEKWLKR
ncbi:MULTISPECIES: Kdo domain containing protein [Flavobacterium]|uniref:Kdo domain containing protein n=1 Tax=Flavobacterium columnare TaxID=996 RepID=A0AA94EXX8_9FLAO|nr:MULTISPECIES: Kdo domain containing protein [Flavobacterium]MCH4828583.1 Kdo domain containing protein [Flavobacterium columnare]MCH4831835.1 Kdo domain containing protein [Flavobacterium columnare]OWP88011.1 Kdo domain containing protein [Flavobacterium covae]